MRFAAAAAATAAATAAAAAAAAAAVDAVDAVDQRMLIEIFFSDLGKSVLQKDEASCAPRVRIPKIRA